MSWFGFDSKESSLDLAWKTLVKLNLLKIENDGHAV